jgi:hypothetical protein
MGPKSKEPPNPSVDLHMIQLGRAGAVGINGPRIHPHCHLPSPEWLNATIDEDP